jgi:hypothetical protein
MPPTLTTPTPPRLLPFDCIALSETAAPRTIGILARNHTDALVTAQELFPALTISLVQISPEW